MTLLLVWLIPWVLLVVPVGCWARRNLRTDRIHEGDELDPISASEAAAIGLLWAALWPLGVIVIVVFGVCALIGLIIDSQMRL